MGVLEQKIQELDRLEEEYKRQRERIKRAISDTVRSVGQNPAITPQGKHMFIIRSSELFDAPWTPDFHDWTVQAGHLQAILGKKPVRQWIGYIEELLARRSKPGWPVITVNKVHLNRKFLQQVEDLL